MRWVALALLLLGPVLGSPLGEDYRNRTPVETLVKYSPEESKCFREKKVYYRGDCRTLLKREVCGENQWLILDERVVPGIRPVCRPKRCDNDHAYWPPSTRCEDLQNNHVCPRQNTKLTVDEFGLGYCGCVKTQMRIHVNGLCYLLHSRGPCVAGEVFVEGNKGGECRGDPCAGRGNGTYLYWKPRGECYLEGSEGPCKEGTFQRGRDGNPSCVDTGTFHLVDVVVDCPMDLDGKCVEGVKIKDDGEKYLQSLLEAAKRRKKRQN